MRPNGVQAVLGVLLPPELLPLLQEGQRLPGSQALEVVIAAAAAAAAAALLDELLQESVVVAELSERGHVLAVDDDPPLPGPAAPLPDAHAPAPPPHGFRLAAVLLAAGALPVAAGLVVVGVLQPPGELDPAHALHDGRRLRALHRRLHVIDALDHLGLRPVCNKPTPHGSLMAFNKGLKMNHSYI